MVVNARMLLAMTAVLLAGARVLAQETHEECAVLAALDFSEKLGAAVQLTAGAIPAAQDLPARCRIAGTIAPETGIEVWLPVEGWNGKLFTAGCYGMCGLIRSDQMEDAAARGYATVTTDMGHSEERHPNSIWAHNNPALETDFAHRATHLAVLAAKELVRAYYGNHEEHSYFRGCSTGGRQALVAAQRYPEDFDGVIAGAPFHQTLSAPHMIWADRANTAPDGSPLLDKPQFELLHRAALAACDAGDGLEDGIVGDPEACRFTPDSLLCTEGETGPCLSRAQVDAARKIYQGAVTSQGERLYPFGATAGSEFTWGQQLLSDDGKPPFFRNIGQRWLQYHAYAPDPPLDSGPFAFDFDRDPARLTTLAGFAPDLQRFSARDGKLLIHHGWVDESLIAAHTLDYWQDAMRAAGGQEALARFARLFMLPGVTHCGGGPGAGDVDYLTALERWVEHDEAPEVLIGYRTKDSVSTLVRQPRFPIPQGELVLARPVYPYPDIARYSGEGDANDPASYLRVRRGSSPEKVADR
jgi:feruloyl esterase